MTAWYNENDAYAAEWLRNLIEAGHIAPGVVDERDIRDVRPRDLDGFTQCHFFAGIGVWSLAIRNAGWPDGRPVWTGSCPCQPFSAAGKRGGVADERHLWPAFYHLIEQCRPVEVLGEQVASKDGLGWLDLVQADLEAAGYASGAVDLGAAGVGAPHWRQRLWFHAQRLADTDDARPQGRLGMPERTGKLPAGEGSVGGGLANAERNRQHGGGRTPGGSKPTDSGGPDRPGPVNGFWRDADWLGCRDEKWRPVEPGTFPLAHGVASRVGRLRAYGNAICAPAAQAFIEAAMTGPV